jgi:hypothetical protein
VVDIDLNRLKVMSVQLGHTGVATTHRNHVLIKMGRPAGNRRILRKTGQYRLVPKHPLLKGTNFEARYG